MDSEPKQGFAIWVTGLPASGKSTLVSSLATQLRARGVNVAVLESDELRKVFTPKPTFDDEERQRFYGQLIYVGTLLVRHGVPVLFDATANRRAWRDQARRDLPYFLEVYIDSPLDVCMARDPKGIYRQARNAKATRVPGLQTPYEAPGNPELVVHGDRERPDGAAERIIAKLMEKGYVRKAP